MKAIRKVEIHYEESTDSFKVYVYTGRSCGYTKSFKTIGEATRHIRDDLNFYEEKV